MSNESIEISQGKKVAGWVVDGTPSQFGLQLINQKVIPLKRGELNFLNKLWLKLKQPQMFYHENDNSVEFATVGFTQQK